MRIDFIKCHGSGNDFALVDARGVEHDDADWGRIARALADRRGAVGSDGLLLLTDGDGQHAFGMRMFNSDGVGGGNVPQWVALRRARRVRGVGHRPGAGPAQDVERRGAARSRPRARRGDDRRAGGAGEP